MHTFLILKKKKTILTHLWKTSIYQTHTDFYLTITKGRDSESTSTFYSAKAPLWDFCIYNRDSAIFRSWFFIPIFKQANEHKLTTEKKHFGYTKKKKKTFYWSNNAIKAEIQAENETLRKLLQWKCVFLSAAFSAGFTTTITTYQIQFVQKQNKQKNSLIGSVHRLYGLADKSTVLYGLYSGKVKTMENRKENFLIKHH